jgi:hypothetical protein
MARILLVTFGAVLAANCGLPGTIDPAPETCFVSDAGYANMNVDRDGSDGVSLSIATLADAYTNITGGVNNPHPGTLSTAELESDGRYLLSCADFSWQRSLIFTVTRPAMLTRFRGEAVFVYAKGKWDVLQSEVESWTANAYGSNVPLWAKVNGGLPARPGTDCDGSNQLTDCSLTQVGSVDFHVALPYTGDYEIKYATPALMNDCPTTGCVENSDPAQAVGKWIALEFKSTLIRVGSPWADCSATDTTEDYSAVSSIVPIYYGHPNLEKAKYETIAAVINSHTTHEITVVLQIFTPTSGNILYDADGSPSFRTNDEKWTIGGTTTAMSDAEPNADPPKIAKQYSMCYRAGTPCPDGNSVCDASYCNIQQWQDIIDQLKTGGVTHVKVLSYIETTTTTLDADGNLVPRAKADIEADIASTKQYITGVDGFYFGGANGDSVAAAVTEVSTAENAAFTTVIATGSPLLDSAALSSADVFVTTNDNLTTLGAWSPYAFYPLEAPTRWAAQVMSVGTGDISGTAEELYDRGYGIVHIHSTSSFADEPADLQAVLDRVTAQKTGGRRLTEERRLTANTPTYRWSCDDTLFKCGPVCLKTQGVSTIEVPDTECAGEPLDPCGCDCLYDARWACDGGDVICQAKDTHSLTHRKVADLVCEMRGDKKPEIDSFTLRTAGECVEVPTARGNVPTQQCLDQYTDAKAEALRAQAAATSTTPEPTEAPTTEAPDTEAPETSSTQDEAPDPTPAPVQQQPVQEVEEEVVTTALPTAGGLNVDMVIWSFAAPAALAALFALLA